MNRFVTLAWGLAAVDATDAVTATSRFVAKARDWVRHHGYAMPWAWVQETGDTFGQHAHILLHVPPELDELFRPMPRRWAQVVTGGKYVAGSVQSQRIPYAKTADADSWAYEAALMGKVSYMLKCAPVKLEGALGLSGFGYKPWGQRTRVIGKRAGAWQRRGRAKAGGV